MAAFFLGDFLERFQSDDNDKSDNINNDKKSNNNDNNNNNKDPTLNSFQIKYLKIF